VRDDTSWEPLNLPSRKEVPRWLVGVVGLVGIAVLVLGIWGFFTKAIGAHVVGCGLDGTGAYAKVRVNNLFGGAHRQEVAVDFYPHGMAGAYAETYTQVMLPAHGHGAAVVHAGFPPWGRTVYILHADSQNMRVVTKKFAMKHRGVSVETVPENDSVSCSVTVPFSTD
jgi:hypothetical protein